MSARRQAGQYRAPSSSIMAGHRAAAFLPSAGRGHQGALTLSFVSIQLKFELEDHLALKSLLGKSENLRTNVETDKRRDSSRGVRKVATRTIIVNMGKRFLKCYCGLSTLLGNLQS